MKVALVHMRQREVGGTERYLNQVARHLAEAGDDVVILCRSHEQMPHPAVRFVTLRDFAVGGAWRMWAFACAVERHLRGSAYDVVFGLGKTWSHDIIRLGGGCHQTYLDTAHGATLTPWESLFRLQTLKHRLALRIEARALAPGAALRVVTNSEMVKRDVLRRHRIPPERVTVVYNGVDTRRFHPSLRATAGRELRRRCGWTEEHLVYLFLGTEYGRKGLRDVLHALPKVLRRQPRARLLVVGYDSAQRRYEREAARAGLAAAVCFLGGRRDAEACFAAADVYVLPTRYDPFANSTLEALASGLPVITTEANGASELLAEGVTGSVIPVVELRNRLADELLFWADPERRRAAAPAVRALAEAHCQENMAETTRTLLREVVQEKYARAGGQENT